jgi:hypothetical protein
MRRSFGLWALFLLPLPASASDVIVRVTDGRVDLTATAAPIAEVLDRLSRQTGMKVVYEGPAPRQLITVSLHGRSPAEAVVGLLEGQGLNYILLGDASGERVQTLMMAGSAPSTSSRPASSTTSPSRAAPPPAPEPDEPVEEPEEEEPVPVQAPPPTGVPQLTPPGTVPNPAVPPIAGMAPGQNVPPGLSIPGLPGFPASASAPMPFGPQMPGGIQPFGPQPTPVQPGAPKTPENQAPP